MKHFKPEFRDIFLEPEYVRWLKKSSRYEKKQQNLKQNYPKQTYDEND